MTYSMTGIDPVPYFPLYGLGDADLALHGAIRMIADASPGYPCRVRLDDAAIGQSMLLVGHISHNAATPYRASHAIFVTDGAIAPARFVDSIPPALDRRILSLRAFDAAGMMTDAALAQPGEADRAVRDLLADPAVDHIDAHNATRGCFAARIERHES